MIVNVNSQLFQKAMKQIGVVMNKKTDFSLVNANNIKLVARDNTMLIFATDLTTSILKKIDADVVAEGTVCLSFPKLKTIADLATQDLSFQLKNARMHIRNGIGHYDLPSTNDFPELPPVPTDLEFKTIPASLLKKSFEQSAYALYKLDGSTSASRSAMTCFYLNKTEVVTTDSVRMAIIKCDTQLDILIPDKLFDVLTTLQTENIKLAYDNNQIYMITEDDSVEVRSLRLKDAKFPHYQSVIPDEMPHYCVCNKDALINAIKAVNIAKRTPLIFTVKESELVVNRINNDDSSSATASIPCTSTIQCECALTERAILEALEVLTSENIQIHFIIVNDNHVQRIIIKDGDNMHVIATMRIDR